MLRPSYFLSDLHRGLRASCETFAEKPNDAQSSLSVIKKEASAFLVGDTLGKQSLRRSPTPTGFAEFVRDVVPTDKRPGSQTPHRDNGKRFVVRADEKLTAFLEREAGS
jgi:hypothetical protein